MDLEQMRAPFKWWWEHTKSERAALLIEAYWNPAQDGSTSLFLFDAGSKPKHQVKNLKRTLFTLGYRLFWRTIDGKVQGWVAPISPTPVLPPLDKRRRLNKDGSDSLLPSRPRSARKTRDG